MVNLYVQNTGSTTPKIDIAIFDSSAANVKESWGAIIISTSNVYLGRTGYKSLKITTV